ncbi:MAG: hypothetical protein ACRDI0_11645 [Actinomycetota bacterium]
MKARALFVGTVGALLLAVASPAAAKLTIAEGHVRGPGLGGGGLRISAPATNGMWESGIDVAGGLDDARAGSIAELGLTAAELGPRYVVTYRFEPSTQDEIVRQELYPHAKGGPVTYTPAGQRLTLQITEEGGPITAGWYRSSPGFFHYLVDQGLPETNPVPAVVDRESVSDTLPAAQATSWGWIALALAGLVALSLAALRLRRRILAVSRGNR